MLDYPIVALLAAIIAIALFADRALPFPAEPTRPSPWIVTGSLGALALWTGDLVHDHNSTVRRLTAVLVIAALISAAARWAAHRRYLVAFCALAFAGALVMAANDNAGAWTWLVQVVLTRLAYVRLRWLHLALGCTQLRNDQSGPASKALLRCARFSTGMLVVAPYCALAFFACDLAAALSGAHATLIWVGVAGAAVFAGVLPSALGDIRLSVIALALRLTVALLAAAVMAYSSGALLVSGEVPTACALASASLLWAGGRLVTWVRAGDLTADDSVPEARLWLLARLSPLADTGRALFAVMAAVGIGATL